MKPLDVLRCIWSADSDLGTRERAVLTALVMRADDRGRCWPSLSRIGTDSGLDRRTVMRALNDLEADGWVQRTRRELPNPTLYTVRFDRVRQTLGQTDPRDTQTLEIGAESHLDRGTVTPELPIELPKELPNTDTVNVLWGVWLDELGGQPPLPKLTDRRRKLLSALHAEQLADRPDPAETFRAICRAVKASPHHMATRAYQLPESLFRNPERRERWALAALAGPSQPTPTTTRRSGYRDPAAGIWTTSTEDRR